MAPFDKPVKRKDLSDSGNWPGGVNNNSFKQGTQFIVPYNNNAADKSPTTSSDSCRPANVNQNFPTPPKYKPKPFSG